MATTVNVSVPALGDELRELDSNLLKSTERIADLKKQLADAQKELQYSYLSLAGGAQGRITGVTTENQYDNLVAKVKAFQSLIEETKEDAVAANEGRRNRMRG